MDRGRLVSAVGPLAARSLAALPAAALLAVTLGLGAGCGKVPISDIEAAFTLADATWFEQEQTLFVFYRVEAQQGLGAQSQLELTYTTDDFALPWTALGKLTPVHTHLPVDCGVNGRCGSLSLPVAKAPRAIGLRLRYHVDGALALDAETNVNLIRAGPPYSNRSLLVYGVFDQTNRRVQWRARHTFPTLRNQEVEALGLRRSLRIEGPGYGDIGRQSGNPYGYGFAADCPAGLGPLGWLEVQTQDRAAFAPETLPLAASTAPVVCARATVTDATGTFTAPALARKNPQVAPAFPTLRSPVKSDTAIGYLLRPCHRTISAEHRAMQTQRLLLGDAELCIDDWQTPGFSTRLAAKLRAQIDLVRARGNDMVLSLALHHDDTTGQLEGLVEQALAQILPFERDKTSPRVSGALVFDSYAYSMVRTDLQRLVLWCPANLPGSDLDQLPTNAQRSCPIQPDLPELSLGPFAFSNLPILPTRDQYLTFIGKYSDGQAGTMKQLTFLAPERTPVSDNVPVGNFGIATFFNDELLTASPADAFSYCAATGTAANVAFRLPGSASPQPVPALPRFHATSPAPQYQLGLFWDFPFLLRLQYEIVIAGAASAYSLTVPFGLGVSSQAYYGASLWQAQSFDLSAVLLQCTRFCAEPTFDSAGVYQVLAPFDGVYQTQCYRPLYPAPGDGGFPLDP